MKKHYRILIKVKEMKRPLDENEIKEASEKHLNLDEPKIMLGKIRQSSSTLGLIKIVL